METVKGILSRSVTIAWRCEEHSPPVIHVDTEELAEYLQWLSDHSMLNFLDVEIDPEPPRVSFEDEDTDD